MSKGKVKHVFPGGNTTQGFFSYYDYIIPPDATRIFVIKGGPGVGKSTFMKKIAYEMLDRGYDVEMHHCSSDNNSLDGIVITDLGIAFVDGTAPHIVDPKNPGCVDEIIHLGDFWNEQKMVLNKDKILNCNRNVSKLFHRAYRVLRAAKAIYDDWEAANGEAMNYALANKKAVQLNEEIFSGIDTTGAGKVRRLFGSAITPNGAVNYLPSVIDTMPKTYIIAGEPGTGKATLLQKVLDTAVTRGFDAEAYYCPLDPYKVEHILIPALGVALTTSSRPHLADFQGTIINMNECLDEEIVEKHSSIIEYDKTMFWQLFDKAISYISQAKKLHDELETYYVPNMDFSGVQQVWEKTLNRVLDYAQKKDDQFKKWVP